MFIYAKYYDRFAPIPDKDSYRIKALRSRKTLVATAMQGLEAKIVSKLL